MANFQGFELYGGATITRVVDGAGAEWIGCTCRRLSDGRFGFTLFRNGVEVPYTPFCTGRGSVNADGHYIATDGKEYRTGAMAGFVALPTIASLPPTTTGPTLRIPAMGGNEGGEIQLAATDGGPNWVIDVYGGTLRLHRGGVVVEQWVKP